VLGHLLLNVREGLPTVLTSPDLQHESEVSRHAVRNRRRLQTSTSKAAGDLQRFGGRAWEEVVGELEDLVLAATGEEFHDDFGRELGA